MKKKAGIVIITVVALLVVLLMILKLTTNYNKVNANKDIRTDLSYVAVNTAPVKALSLNDSLLLTGCMIPFTEVDVASQAAGAVTLMDAELGAVKAKGSVIATIDNKLKKLAVQKAKNAKDKLSKDLQRCKNLYNGGSLTEQQLDDAQSYYDDAVIQLEQAQKQLDDATIISPVSGIVTKKLIEQGEYVNTGTPLVTLVDISKLKIKLNVSEANVYLLKAGDKAIITTDIYPGVTYEGSVSFISPQGDASHNYVVEIVISNDGRHLLKSGTFAKVLFRLPSEAEALYIPREAILGSTSDAEVYVAENNKAVRRKITTAGGNEQYIKVISGLKEGENVITNGQINLSDHKDIKVIK